MYINGAYRLACQTNVKHLSETVVTVSFDDALEKVRAALG